MRVYGFEFLKSNVKVAKEDYNKWTKQQKGFKFLNSLEHFMDHVVVSVFIQLLYVYCYYMGQEE